MPTELGRVILNREVAPEIYELLLEAPLAAGRARPGQFLEVKTEATLLRRPLSLWRIERPHLGLLYRIVGSGTRWLSERRPGESLDLLGPLGHGFTLDGSGPLFLVGGGMGIAPLLPVAQRLASHRPVQVLLGFRDVQRRVGVAEFTATGSAVRTIIDTQGTALDLLREALRAEPTAEVMACGPRPLLEGILRETARRDRVWLSLEEHLGCGVGACLGCSAGGLKLCQDGPVLSAEEVARFWKRA